VLTVDADERERERKGGGADGETGRRTEGDEKLGKKRSST
jgi:hypothetical protein